METVVIIIWFLGIESYNAALLVCNSECSPALSWTHSNPPASASQLLELLPSLPCLASHCKMWAEFLLYRPPIPVSLKAHSGGNMCPKSLYVSSHFQKHADDMLAWHYFPWKKRFYFIKCFVFFFFFLIEGLFIVFLIFRMNVIKARGLG